MFPKHVRTHHRLHHGHKPEELDFLIRRESVSGGATSSQMQREFGRLNEEEKENLLKGVGLRPGIPSGAGLLLKANLALSWNKLRHLRRWLRNWNVSLDSESKDREKAKGMTSPLVAEQLPFTFTVKGPDGKLATEVRLASCVCLEDISSTVLQRLDLLEREGKLTWHGVIPSDEIWLKIGGDKGGGSTKAVFELCNVAHPNSIENTIVWNIFQAPDRRHNIETAYKINLSQINALCGTMWK
ncbi:uncharacterized protein [Ptychodera flava]|uniref:uncharacterized protein n=1 Tax=Ptychodera flava TaxID=63121 RepID=UPI003969D2E5